MFAELLENVFLWLSYQIWGNLLMANTGSKSCGSLGTNGLGREILKGKGSEAEVMLGLWGGREPEQMGQIEGEVGSDRMGGQRFRGLDHVKSCRALLAFTLR